MSFREFLVGCLCLWLSSTACSSQSVSDADDPELRAAAYRWLHREDTGAALAEIGRIGREGNIAAQILANSLFIRVANDFPNLDRTQRLALFGSASEGQLTRFRPFRISRGDTPPFSAASEIWHAESGEEWRQLAEALWEADLRQNALHAVRGGLVNHSAISREIALFAEGHVDLSNREIGDLWLYFFIEGLIHTSRTNDQMVDRWNENPWTAEREQRFLSALNDGSWPAIWAGGLMTAVALELPFLGGREAWLRRLSSISRSATLGREATEEILSAAEVMELGAILLSDTNAVPYLLPIRRLCHQFCAEAIAECMATVTLSTVYQDRDILGLEPLIDAESYYESQRAVEDVLATIRWRRREWPDRGVMLPTCLANSVEQRVSEN